MISQAVVARCSFNHWYSCNYFEEFMFNYLALQRATGQSGGVTGRAIRRSKTIQQDSWFASVSGRRTAAAN